MPEYILVIGSYQHLDLFVNQVNDKMRQSYSPIGGVCNVGGQLYQSMIGRNNPPAPAASGPADDDDDVDPHGGKRRKTRRRTTRRR